MKVFFSGTINEVFCLFMSLILHLSDSWAAQYNDLIEDTDMRVRENTLKLMEQIAKKVGRKLAPHLKALIGPWIVARFDPRSDISKAAIESFRVRRYRFIYTISGL